MWKSAEGRATGCLRERRQLQGFFSAAGPPLAFSPGRESAANGGAFFLILMLLLLLKVERLGNGFKIKNPAAAAAAAAVESAPRFPPVRLELDFPPAQRIRL